MKKIIPAIVTIFIFSGCASILLPRHQPITINTKNKDAEVYIDNEKAGEGSQVHKRIRKQGTSQIVVKAPEYKNSYYCLVANKRPAAYWPLHIMSAITIYGLFEKYANNCFKYPDVTTCSPKTKIPHRTDDFKYVNLNAIKLDIDDVNKQIYSIKIPYKDFASNKLKEYEQTEKNNIIKEESKKKKKNVVLLNPEEEIKTIKFDDTQFSKDIKDALIKSGFTDTINEIFFDNNNTLHIEALIKEIAMYRIVTRSLTDFYKIKLGIKWYMKNNYGEIIDSLEHDSYSGDFIEFNIENMTRDAIEKSYLSLFEKETFKKELKYISELNAPEKNTRIDVSWKHYIKDVSEANLATVIIKKEKGHGSGFAISPDGYIITNYHVIASNHEDKQDSLTVILHNGEEYPAKIVTYNKYRDLALLKIDKTFDKTFALPSKKTYKNMEDVYAIGAPKSIQLGQSVSTGIISSERNVNKNSFIQLNMSLNSGNSGGPLINKEAKLHGVIVSKLFGFGVEGISFAIPAYKIKEYLNITTL
ncbi:MAG: trypsin-like peptidase domain-containing protein [Bacteroidales bacterium]|jgi:serine protease Do|nr:trypsin-like peptidase domain-containing protein [Bacteroidales bacterium]